VVRLVGAIEPRVADQFVRQIGRFHAVVVERELRVALELIRAAAGDEVDAEAAGLHLQIVAAGVDRDLVEGIEVEIHRRGAAGGRIGDDDAVEVPHRVGGERALADERRLLARFVAADVDAIDGDAGHGLQHRPRDPSTAACSAAPRRSASSACPIFLTSTTGVSAVTVTVSSTDFTAIGKRSVAFTPVVTMTSRSILLKPLRLVGDLISAGIQVRNRNWPLAVGDRGARLAADRHRLERDVDSRQHTTVLIGDRAVDISAGDLRPGVVRERAEEQDEDQAEHSFHTGSFHSKGRTHADLARGNLIHRVGRQNLSSAKGEAFTKLYAPSTVVGEPALDSCAIRTLRARAVRSRDSVPVRPCFGAAAEHDQQITDIEQCPEIVRGRARPPAASDQRGRVVLAAGGDDTEPLCALGEGRIDLQRLGERRRRTIAVAVREVDRRGVDERQAVSRDPSESRCAFEGVERVTRAPDEASATPYAISTSTSG
jgi:hypothetical protein